MLQFQIKSNITHFTLLEFRTLTVDRVPSDDPCAIHIPDGLNKKTGDGMDEATGNGTDETTENEMDEGTGKTIGKRYSIKA